MTLTEDERQAIEVAKLRHGSGDLIAIIERLKAAAPQWTSEPPTRPGFYWAARRLETAHVVRVVRDRDKVEVHNTHSGSWYDLTEDYELWAGPIEPPPMPEPADYCSQCGAQVQGFHACQYEP